MLKKGWLTGIAMGIGMITGIIITASANLKNNHKWQELSDKHLSLVLLFNQWMIAVQEGKSIVSYFHKNHIKTVAIYGMSYLGKRLYTELRNSDVQVKYGIDQNAKVLCSEIDILSPDGELPLVDTIIVTPIYYFNEVYEKLSQKTEAEIVSLETILYEI